MANGVLRSRERLSIKVDQAKKRAIPDIAIAPELLRRFNANVRFQGKQILGLGPQLQDISAAVQLHDGHLKLTPHFGVGGGTVDTTVEVVARTDAMKSSMKTPSNMSTCPRCYVNSPVHPLPWVS